VVMASTRNSHLQTERREPGISLGVFARGVYEVSPMSFLNDSVTICCMWGLWTKSDGDENM
jgi:hypothetical protein